MKPLTEKDLTLFSNFTITSADTDMFGRIRIGALVNLLIQSAIQSAEVLGFGFDGLKVQQLFWVLSRLSIEITRPLTWNEKVVVETWPKTLEGLLYIRDFVVSDSSGQVVARATSGWLAIDAETKKPKIIEGLQADMFVFLKQKHALATAPEKLPATQEGDHFELRTSFFDIDLNKHVTSTRYIDWMMDTFDAQFHRSHYAKQLSINFMKETMLGDNILIVRESPNESHYNFEGTNSLQKSIAFRGKLVF